MEYELRPPGGPAQGGTQLILSQKGPLDEMNKKNGFNRFIAKKGSAKTSCGLGGGGTGGWVPGGLGGGRPCLFRDGGNASSDLGEGLVRDDTAPARGGVFLPEHEVPKSP